MRAIEIYRRYRHRKVSKEVLERLETMIPYKWYAKIKKESDLLPEPENFAKKRKPEEQK